MRAYSANCGNSLAQQTATSDVLSVISSSPGDLKPVFDAMLANAARLCEAQFGNLCLYDEDGFRFVAMHNMPAVYAERWQREPLFRPSPLAPIVRAVATKNFVHIVNLKDDPAYLQRDPPVVSLVDVGGARTLLIVPLIKDAEVIGTLGIFRQEVRPFADKQIDLVRNFAAQAVIAIENARLLNELRQRTNDLTELLEQQTATSEVLQVISSSPGELEPVFASMLENAVRICDAQFGNIYRWDGDLHILAASHKTPAAFAEARREVRQTFKLDEKDPLGRMILSKRAVHVADLSAEQVYIDRSSPGAVMGVELGGIRTTLMVPLLKDDEVVGAFVLSRRDQVQPFTDKQVALVTNLRRPGRDRHREREAALEAEHSALMILPSLWSSRRRCRRCSALLARHVAIYSRCFATMVENAVRICDAEWGNIHRWDGDGLHLVASHNTPPAFADFAGAFHRPRPDPKDVFGRT